MKMWVFNYRPELDKRIINLGGIAKGTGCTVLECIVAQDNYTLIAKQWRRGEPYGFDAIIRFPGNRFYKSA